MHISTRGWSVVVLITGLLAAVAAGVASLPTASGQQTANTGELTEQSLGNMLSAMGLQTKKEQQRYDFAFKAVHQGNEWELSMSAVLSQNGETLWVMAWLDELPKSATDVPRTSLLRLLALNDSLGQGKFFAYISSNRRFVLERIVPNRNMTSAGFREILQDLGSSVVQTYPYWTVENWKTGTEGSAAAAAGAAKEDPARTTSAGPAAQSRKVPTSSAVNDSQFQGNPQKR